MDKKFLKLTSLGLVFLLSLAACQEKEQKVEESSELVDQVKEKEDEKDISQETSKEEKNPSENNEKLAKLYNKVLDNIDSYEFTDIEEGKYSYSYSLVKTDESDFPKLLLAQNTDFGISYLKFISANDDITDVVYDDEMISIGVAPAGGFRGFITQNADLDGLIYTTFMSGTGEGSQEKITTSIEDDTLKLEKELIWEGRIDTLEPDESTEIEFSEIDDRDQIYDLAAIKDGDYDKSLKESIEKKKEESDQAVKENVESPTEDESQTQSEPGTMVATGQVRVFDHDGMVAYQQLNPEMLPDMGEKYVVLILDKPMDFTLISGDGFSEFTRNADLISLPEDMMSYDGKRITISFGPSDGYWQSDVSLPMDAPRMHQVKVLE